MKKTINVTSPLGLAVPGMGRLGKGQHKDIELTSEQLTAIKADPAAEIITSKKQEG